MHQALFEVLVHVGEPNSQISCFYEAYIVKEEIEEKQINSLGSVKKTETKYGAKWGNSRSVLDEWLGKSSLRE